LTNQGKNKEFEMQNDLKWIAHITDSEYNGMSFNGPNLMKTLKSLNIDQVTSTDTYEGYSVWGIVLHLMKWKYELARLLGAKNLDAFPYEDDNFPQLPDLLSAAAWEDTLLEMDGIHAVYMKVLSAFNPAKLADKMEWGCSFGEAIAWMATHDTYHLAQIRNMGLDIHET
jgi:hypothetical protein